MTLRLRRRAAAQLLAQHRDLLDARPGASPEPLEARRDAASPLEQRGWSTYLLALDDAALARIEGAGTEAPWPEGSPTSLQAFVEDVRAVVASAGVLAAASPSAAPPPRHATRRETPRKRAQIDAFAEAITPLARSCARVVDVGSGHGHLTRDLASRLALPVVGLERDPKLAETARALARDGGDAAFAVTDVLAQGLAVEAEDCIVGLHACGELGDVMVEAAARSGASLALVGCCLQKRRQATRVPLGPEAADMAAWDVAALALPRALLGLSNLTARDDGVEASRVANLDARARRLTLHRLLVGAGFEVRLGAEIEGLNRRAAHGELEAFVARAFALRGRAPPPRADLVAAARWAARSHAHARRLALPRTLLARVLELFVLFDRAHHLEARGFEVEVGVVFSPEVSARNLALLASRAS
jgi:SAM-dependent methyltransferase